MSGEILHGPVKAGSRISAVNDRETQQTLLQSRRTSHYAGVIAANRCLTHRISALDQAFSLPEERRQGLILLPAQPDGRDLVVAASIIPRVSDNGDVSHKGRVGLYEVPVGKHGRKYIESYPFADTYGSPTMKQLESVTLYGVAEDQRNDELYEMFDEAMSGSRIGLASFARGAYLAIGTRKDLKRADRLLGFAEAMLAQKSGNAVLRRVMDHN